MERTEQTALDLLHGVGNGKDRLAPTVFRAEHDDILGDAVVFAYVPGPQDHPEREQGLCLLWARQPDRLSGLIAKLNETITKILVEPQIKEKLAANRLTAPLFDTERLTRNLESAFVTMWERAERGEPPQAFAVAETAGAP